jgi:hypothetical protein
MSQSHLQRLAQLGFIGAVGAAAASSGQYLQCDGDKCTWNPPAKVETAAKPYFDCEYETCSYSAPSSESLQRQFSCDEGDQKCSADYNLSFADMRKMAKEMPDWRISKGSDWEGVDKLFDSDSSEIVGSEAQGLWSLISSAKPKAVLIETGGLEEMRDKVRTLQRIKANNGGVCHPNIECLLDFFVVSDANSRLRPVVVTRAIPGKRLLRDVLENPKIGWQEKWHIIEKALQAKVFLDRANASADQVRWDIETNEPVFAKIYKSEGLRKSLTKEIHDWLRREFDRKNDYSKFLETILVRYPDNTDDTVLASLVQARQNYGF